MTAALILDDAHALSSGAAVLRREPLNDDGRNGLDEKWLQTLLFAHPELIPLDRLEPGAGPLIPLCREFPLPREGGLVFPDLIGVTRSGRFVIVAWGQSDLRPSTA